MTRYKSKTLATWIALAGGSLGLHRFYLYGMRDVWGWLWPLPTLVGAYGVQRMLSLGQDDRLAWLLLPSLGLSLAAAMLSAIAYGLMPDERWNARFNAESRAHESGWAVVFGVVIALFVGAIVLMSTIAFSGQRYFEYQAEAASSSANVQTKNEKLSQ